MYRCVGRINISIKTYPNAGHQLIVSKSGYNGEPALPERFVSGYPQIMITWLAVRGFETAGPYFQESPNASGW